MITNMTKKMKNLLTVLFSVVAILTPALVPAVTFAAGCSNIQGQVSNGIDVAGSSNAGTAGSCGGSGIQQGIQNTAKVAINILSIVVGVVAVIMIIYGGFRYITSGGESGNVEGAKKTLLFAIVGLVIVALAQIIVHWVLNTSTQIANPGGFIHF